MSTRAIVLAAGTGSRLGAITAEQPKCLVALAGRPLLDWQLDALRAAGIDDITLVTGYRPETLQGRATRTAHNARFAETNMVVSLLSAREQFDGTADVLIAYGDIVYEPRLVVGLLTAAAAHPMSVAVDTQWRRLWELRMTDPLADAETLRINDRGLLREVGAKPSSYDEIEAQYIGLIAVRADFAREVVRRYDALGPERDRMYMTAFVQSMIDDGVEVGAVRVNGGWIEVDTPEDLAIYEQLLARGELDQIVMLEARG